MNYKKKLSRVKYILAGLVFVTLLISSLAYSLLKVNRDTENLSRYMLVDKENIYLVYEDKLAIEIPFEVYIDKNTKVEDMVKARNYEEILNSINSVFPEKIEQYRVLKYGSIDVPVMNARKIPEVVVDEKRYILTSTTENLFEEFYNKVEKKELDASKIIVDILNANGKAGYARKTGDKLNRDLGVKYNAANYEKDINESFIIINDLSREQTEEIVLSINEKYIKIREDASIPTLSNVVIVLGKETQKIFDIEVVGGSSKGKAYMNTLKKAGYEGIKSVANAKKEEETIVSYNPEDYFVAYKIAHKLGVEKLVEDKKLKNKIVVLVGEK